MAIVTVNEHIVWSQMSEPWPCPSSSTMFVNDKGYACDVGDPGIEKMALLHCVLVLSSSKMKMKWLAGNSLSERA